MCYCPEILLQKVVPLKKILKLYESLPCIFQQAREYSDFEPTRYKSEQNHAIKDDIAHH